MPDQLIPAVRYLRMSAEHQQYSLENQSASITTASGCGRRKRQIDPNIWDHRGLAVVSTFGSGLPEICEPVFGARCG